MVGWGRQAVPDRVQDAFTLSGRAFKDDGSVISTSHEFCPGTAWLVGPWAPLPLGFCETPSAKPEMVASRASSLQDVNPWRGSSNSKETSRSLSLEGLVVCGRAAEGCPDT